MNAQFLRGVSSEPLAHSLETTRKNMAFAGIDYSSSEDGEFTQRLEEKWGQQTLLTWGKPKRNPHAPLKVKGKAKDEKQNYRYVV